jgi:hypothetical protein
VFCPLHPPTAGKCPSASYTAACIAKHATPEAFAGTPFSLCLLAFATFLFFCDKRTRRTTTKTNNIVIAAYLGAQKNIVEQKIVGEVTPPCD